MVWIAGAITLVLSLVGVCSDVIGKYYVDGAVYDTHYHMMETDREYARQLSGRKVNQALLSEMQDAYRKIPRNVARYSVTQEYQTYARPYSEIFQFTRKVLGISDWEELLDWEVNEDALYAAFIQNIEGEGNGSFLTEGEKAYWTKKAAALDTPFVFGYAGGYQKLLYSCYGICYMLLFFIAVCLCDLFTREHILRTDQLLLSSRLGKGQIYWAKVLAGMSFVGGITLIMAAVNIAAALWLYGADGFGVMVQFSVYDYPLTLSMGRSVIMLFVLMLCAALVTGAFVMMLSELLHNATATLAVAGSIVFISMLVRIPAQYRIAAQLWTYLPSKLLDSNSIFSLWLVPVFGGYFTAWQAVPVLYIILGGIFLCCGMYAYRRYQVSGR